MDIEGAGLEVFEELAGFVSRNKDCVIAFASYHFIEGRPTWMWIEEKFAEHSGLILKTTYPYYITTFIVNKNNDEIKNRLEHLPSLEKIYELIKV